ncbi:MAG: VacJ family lipoprotein [Rickettsiales bacterium]|jgi:phospholipid-binding lipoprotein MlaA|nr:VacJ family lipoprotein [Rickettsiales bacterium]
MKLEISSCSHVFALSLIYCLFSCTLKDERITAVAGFVANESENLKEDYGYDYVDEKDAVNDPLERINRVIFSFNIFLLENVADPTIKFYKSVTNEFFRSMISNIGNRLQDPLILLNSLLQADIYNISNTAIVFATNMTIGCLGLFDPAGSFFDIKREKRTFGQTLALYGVANGFYLMLPFFGPRTLREGIGSFATFYADPFSIDMNKNFYLLPPKYFALYVDKVDNAITLNKDFVQMSFDPYIFIRYSYLSNLEYTVNNLKKIKKSDGGK